MVLEWERRGGEASKAESQDQRLIIHIASTYLDIFGSTPTGVSLPK